MTTRLFARRALLPDGWAENVVIEWDSDGCIVAVREQVIADTSSEPACEQVDIVIPGMPNLHSHAFQRAMAGLTEYRAQAADSFWTWRDLMYRFAAQITPEQLQAIATQLYAEMLSAGYTSVAEFHYLHHDSNGTAFTDPAEMSWRIVAAAETSGIGLTHLPVLYRYSGFAQRTPKIGQQRFLHDSDQYALLLQTLHKAFSGKRHRLGIAPHSLRAVSKAMLRRACDELNSLDASAPIHIHIAEQTLEVDDCLQAYGARPVQWLLNNADVNQRWCLVHATHLDDNEISGLARSGAVAGICPTTEANLGDGFFPTREYLSCGGVIGIGSDSHISVSPIEEMRWLEYAARLQHRERALLCSPTQSVGRYLYEQNLRGGALALGQNVGQLAPNMQADLVVLDDQHPLLFGKKGDALLDSFMFAGNQNTIRHVMVSGIWQVRDGLHIQADTIARQYRLAMQELMQL